jgi:hypothetical protein
MRDKEVSPARYLKHSCKVEYKDVLERLTVTNSIAVHHNAVCCRVGYGTSAKTVDGLLTLIFRRPKWYNRKHFCQYRWLILLSWIKADPQPFDYTWCRTTNHWRSVDTQFWEILTISSPVFFGWKLADTCKVGRCRCAAPGSFQMPDEKLLTFGWCSIVGDSRNFLYIIFALKDGRFIQFAWMLSRSLWIIPNATQQLLTLFWRAFLGDSWDVVPNIFA